MTKKIFFYGYYDKEFLKNNIKIIILLKMTWIKNDFETTVINYDFKENCKTTIFKNISKTFKTTVINDGFSHFKKK